MIFDALSNIVYRMSLHGPGAELDGGGCSNTPPARRVRRRAAAGAGPHLKKLADTSDQSSSFFTERFFRTHILRKVRTLTPMYITHITQYYTHQCKIFPVLAWKITVNEIC